MRTTSGARRRRLPERPTAVLLAGSGSDEIFVRAAFGRPLAAVGVRLITPRPVAGSAVVRGYLDVLDEAVAAGPEVLVGGVSLGAQVAVRWAARRATAGLDGPTGLLLALPAWSGSPAAAPAAAAAATSAGALRRDGLTATLADARPNIPEWLADELTRAWTRHGDGLADSLDTAAATPGPTEDELARLDVPVGIVGLRDDPIHPLVVATRWRALVPRSALVNTTLAAMGRDPATLGRAATLAWLRAGCQG